MSSSFEGVTIIAMVLFASLYVGLRTLGEDTRDLLRGLLLSTCCAVMSGLLLFVLWDGKTFSYGKLLVSILAAYFALCVCAYGSAATAVFVEASRKGGYSQVRRVRKKSWMFQIYAMFAALMVAGLVASAIGDWVHFNSREAGIGMMTLLLWPFSYGLVRLAHR